MVRESRSSLAGVVMAVAVEGMSVGRGARADPPRADRSPARRPVARRRPAQSARPRSSRVVAGGAASVSCAGCAGGRPRTASVDRRPPGSRKRHPWPGPRQELRRRRRGRLPRLRRLRGRNHLAGPGRLRGRKRLAGPGLLWGPWRRRRRQCPSRTGRAGRQRPCRPRRGARRTHPRHRRLRPTHPRHRQPPRHHQRPNQPEPQPRQVRRRRRTREPNPLTAAWSRRGLTSRAPAVAPRWRRPVPRRRWTVRRRRRRHGQRRASTCSTARACQRRRTCARSWPPAARIPRMVSVLDSALANHTIGLGQVRH